MTARWPVVLLCCAVLAPSRGFAQRIERGAPVTLAGNPRPAARILPTADDDGETDPVVTEGAPRTFRIVSIPIPVELRSANGPVDYSVVSVGALKILGAKQGSIPPASGKRDVIFTIAIPSGASARRMAVGYVTFSAPGMASVRVPVNLDVSSVHRIAVHARRDVVGVHPGERVTLGFAVQNTGNGDDTVVVVLHAPAGWTSPAADSTRLVVPAGAQVDHSVRVSIPPDVGTGSWFVDLVAMRGSKEVARTQATLEVAPPFSAPVRAGPSVTAGAMSVFSGAGMGGTIGTVGLDGNLLEGVRVTGRYTSPVPRDGVSERAISQLGYSSRANSVAVRADHWGVGLGMTGLAASELAGAGIFGRGVSAGIHPGAFALQATAVAPVSADTSRETERNVALRGDWSTARALFTISASHLRDAEFNARQLDAFTVGASGPLAGTTYQLEAGPRRYAAGSGFGALAELRANSPTGDFSVRAMQAPGGTGAFAASRSGLFASAGHQLTTRLDLSGSAWHTDDDNAAFSSLRSTGWALTPRIDVTRAFSLAADVHGMSYQSTGVDNNSFGSSMTSYGARASLLRRWVQVRGDVAWSRMLRDVTVDGGLFRTVTDRATVQGQVDASGRRGRVGLGSTLETSMTDVDGRSRQTTLDVHLEQMMPVERYPGLRLNMSLQRFGTTGVPSVVLARGGFELPLGDDFRFRLDVDRTGLASASGHGTVISTRLERSMGLPFIDRRTEHGVVFQDLNGNGRRDAGEPGFSGAIVRRGAESAMSDRDGEFRLLRDNREPMDLDARTLPAGWILSPRLSAGKQIEFGVVPTATLEVSVVASNDSTPGATPFSFGAVTMALVDSAGRRWVVRTETRHATFDALPAGSYRIETEASDTSEPLLIDVPAHVDVVAGRIAQAALTVRRRPVRIFKSAAPSTPKP